MIRLIRTKTLKELTDRLASAEQRLASMAEVNGDSRRKLGLTAWWLTANILAGGRKQRKLSDHQLKYAANWAIRADIENDGGVTISVVPREPQKLGDSSAPISVQGGPGALPPGARVIPLVQAKTPS